MGDELRRELSVFVPGVELASCCWVSGICLSLLAGVGPPSSPGVPCWALRPDWLQLWFWLSGWLSAMVLFSSEKQRVQNESKSNQSNTDSFRHYHPNKTMHVLLTYTQKCLKNSFNFDSFSF